MKELTEIKDGLLRIFESASVDDLSQAVKDAVMANDLSKYRDYLELIGNDLDTDYLQQVFQYYHAERVTLKQDYTPKSLAKLLAKLTAGADEIIDLCAGSGALSVQALNNAPETSINALEYDRNVIPFLLFNLAVRNAQGMVTCGDGINRQEVFEKYKLTKGDEFSKCEKVA